jgi:hypothetical protein
VGWGDVGVQWAGGKVCSGHALAMLCHPMSISSPVCVNFTPCLFYPLSVSPPYVCFHPMSVSPLGCNKSSIYKSNTCVVSVCECVCVCMCVCVSPCLFHPLSVSPMSVSLPLHRTTTTSSTFSKVQPPTQRLPSENNKPGSSLRCAAENNLCHQRRPLRRINPDCA